MRLLPFSLAAFFLLSDALAAPSPAYPAQSIPLVRRARPQRNATELGSWLQGQKAGLEAKYGGGRSAYQKRATGLNLITNQDSDSSFYGSLAVGTPAVSFNVILDTGSADLWLASNVAAASLDSGTPTFDASSSSSFKDLNTTFRIEYGLGAAAGVLGQDKVQMAGFEVNTQAFGVVEQITANLLNAPVSGLIGLAFQNISSSGAKPFWQTLAETSGTMDSPLMAIQLTRYTDDAKAQTLEPGGTLTFGAVNTTLFTGNIDYQDIPNGLVGYWLQELTSACPRVLCAMVDVDLYLSVGRLDCERERMSLTSGSTSFAAIDTGTTLVGGPSDAIASLYAQIPGSVALTGQSQGFWSYPCSSTINIALTFGNSTTSWPISPKDFLFSQSGSSCIGAFFEANTSGTTPPWIIGDTFLKNVYSVFRASPPAVGFAELSSVALAMNGAVGSAPSPTIGSVSATVGASGSSSQNSAARDVRAGGVVVAWATVVVVGVVWGALGS
ncbi:Aspartic protease [Grifola frondosa]|uniref:Aspartic protease n=1 Tax=Grifola frondosa TaxID=5627 RepID=A0A1C7LQ00_GRIFR|nr:Aspartic protease [Grifola frondosa]